MGFATKMSDENWKEAQAMKDAGAKGIEIAKRFNVTAALISQHLGTRRADSRRAKEQAKSAGEAPKPQE